MNILTPIIKEDQEIKEYFLEGIFVEPNIPDKNNRIYLEDVINSAIERYKHDLVETNYSFGTVSNFNGGDFDFNLTGVSHIITDIWKDYGHYYFRVKILDTPNGRLVKTLIDYGVRFIASMRGFGSVTHKEGFNYVNSDFHLLEIQLTLV